jgi:hypothetical protein
MVKDRCSSAFVVNHQAANLDRGFNHTGTGTVFAAGQIESQE